MPAAAFISNTTVRWLFKMMLNYFQDKVYLHDTASLFLKYSLTLFKISKTMVLQASTRGLGSSQNNSKLQDIVKCWPLKNAHETSPIIQNRKNFPKVLAACWNKGETSKTRFYKLPAATKVFLGLEQNWLNSKLWIMLTTLENPKFSRNFKNSENTEKFPKF